MYGLICQLHSIPCFELLRTLQINLINPNLYLIVTNKLA